MSDKRLGCTALETKGWGTEEREDSERTNGYLLVRVKRDKKERVSWENSAGGQKKKCRKVGGPQLAKDTRRKGYKEMCEVREKEKSKMGDKDQEVRVRM